MNKMLVDFPTPYESKRLWMRCYRHGDGKWYYQMSLRNRQHLQKFEAENVAANIVDEAAAEALVNELACDWEQGKCFFIGAFEKKTGEFVAQIYAGPIDWKLAEFQIGYFADVDHEGQGYVTEAVTATLGILFNRLNAHRVRLQCDENNLRSIRVAERCHMLREGHLRENKRNPDGAYSGSFIFGLLKSEFLLG